ncbi:MAG: phosphoribosyltransferase family protein [Rubricoccaceae bacterium]|nr:phosphoribosyltransferase family protein [Rubricoccaceae bacterium]
MPPFAPRPLRGLTGAARAVAGLAFPTLCLGCDRRVPPGAESVPLCPACHRRLPRAEAPDVRARLAALPTGDVFERAAALWVYDSGGAVQRLQHTLKYRDRPTLGLALGRLLAGAVQEAFGAVRYDAVVPIPLARVRRLERGYNQSETLAEGLAAVWPDEPPVAPGLLVRTRPTRSQTTLSRARRWDNVDGAFATPDPGAVRGRHLLVVDDVLTTGATLTAAAQPLLDAGATVDLATFALAAI